MCLGLIHQFWARDEWTDQRRMKNQGDKIKEAEPCKECAQRHGGTLERSTEHCSGGTSSSCGPYMSDEEKKEEEPEVQQELVLLWGNILAITGGGVRWATQ